MNTSNDEQQGRTPTSTPEKDTENDDKSFVTRDVMCLNEAPRLPSPQSSTGPTRGDVVHIQKSLSVGGYGLEKYLTTQILGIGQKTAIGKRVTAVSHSAITIDHVSRGSSFTRNLATEEEYEFHHRATASGPWLISNASSTTIRMEKTRTMRDPYGAFRQKTLISSTHQSLLSQPRHPSTQKGGLFQSNSNYCLAPRICQSGDSVSQECPGSAEFGAQLRCLEEVGAFMFLSQRQLRRQMSARRCRWRPAITLGNMSVEKCVWISCGDAWMEKSASWGVEDPGHPRRWLDGSHRSSHHFFSTLADCDEPVVLKIADAVEPSRGGWPRGPSKTCWFNHNSGSTFCG